MYVYAFGGPGNHQKALNPSGFASVLGPMLARTKTRSEAILEAWASARTILYYNIPFLILLLLACCPSPPPSGRRGPPPRELLGQRRNHGWEYEYEVHP